MELNIQLFSAFVQACSDVESVTKADVSQTSPPPPRKKRKKMDSELAGAIGDAAKSIDKLVAEAKQRPKYNS